MDLSFPLWYDGREYVREDAAMEKIASFTIDHTKLMPGIYVSRVDRRGDVTVTTFDLRVTAPNREPPMDIPAMHTAEHLGATYLRNSPGKEDVVYFGPMGCRTGFYLVLFGELKPEDILERVKSMCAFIIGYEGEIPGAKADECGNWRSHDPEMCKYYMKKYLKDLTDCPRTRYPEKEDEAR